MRRKPYATHTQNTHDKGRDARSKYIKTHWKHANTIRKPYTKRTVKTRTRNAETHTTGSQKNNENITPKNTQAHSKFLKKYWGYKNDTEPYANHTHTTHTKQM